MVGDNVQLPCKVGGLGNLESQVNPKGLYTGPYFSPAILSNYTVIVGDTVHLFCKVEGLGSLESKVNPKGLYSGTLLLPLHPLELHRHGGGNRPPSLSGRWSWQS
jgi:hypothetical protein